VVNSVKRFRPVILNVVQVDHLEFLMFHRDFHKSLIKRSLKGGPSKVCGVISVVESHNGFATVRDEVYFTTLL